MGTIRSSFQLMRRALVRRKTKQISVIFAIFLGVTILVGVQITAETLSETFLTSLLVSQGENDLTINPTTQGSYFNSSDLAVIQNATSNLHFTAAGKNYTFSKPLGIMGVLLTSSPVIYGSQLEPAPDFFGINPNYNRSFGYFYDWRSGSKLAINSLVGNNSVIISSTLAKNLAIKKSNYTTPFILKAQFSNSTFDILTHKTVLTSFEINLSVNAIYDSKKPGIGALNNQNGRVVFALTDLQNYTKWLNNGVTDRISDFYISFKKDHFTTGEFPKPVLEGLVNATKEKLPTFPEYNSNGKPVLDTNGNQVYTSLYSVSSDRITIFNIVDSIKQLLNSFLTTLGLLIIATGLLLITNIQLMSVEDREFQTGVLRAVGENRLGISRIYILETFFQGIIGGILGLGGGLVFGWVVAYYLSNLFGTGAGTVAPVIPASLIAYSVLVGVTIAVLTGLIPAIRASRVNIVEAIRGIKIFFEDKSSRNFLTIGFVIFLVGIYILLENGIFNTTRQPFWVSAGWNTIPEQETILLGLGFVFIGFGTMLTRFIDRIKAINITAILLWATPVTAYTYTLKWVATTSNGPTANTTNFLLVSITEIVIGSVVLIGVNLNFIMAILRAILLKFRFFKGVGQISPALIKSHKTRSTLTFAIFAVVLTLNVTIASLVATEINASVGKANSDSRGVDIAVSLNKPDNVSYPYTAFVRNLSKDITDVIPFRTCVYCIGPDIPFTVSVVNPDSAKYQVSKDTIPLKMVEVTKQEIIGNGTDSNNNWRYDLYLANNNYPDPVRPLYNNKMSDAQLLTLSRKSWEYLFNSTYTMAAYNVSIRRLGGGFGRSGGSLTGVPKLTENGTVIKNPIVFSDSFLLKLGQQIWVLMNTTYNGSIPVRHYQSFTIGGYLDRSRAAGFPFSSSGFDTAETTFGDIFMPQFWTNKTDFFGNANPNFAYKRGLTQYDSFAVKTIYQINDPRVLTIAQKIEKFTNLDKIGGYQYLIHDKYLQASSVTIWSRIESNLQAIIQITNFLQIYVSFGLLIGTLGMSVIAVRNVAERKREIGMMRAIGFPKMQVMMTVLLELLVLGVIGLVIGVSNGIIINVGLANLSNNTVIIPWNTIELYLGFIAFVAILSGAIPGWIAARIPASEALRYTG